ncbi:MAG: LytTR family DNA-binding domain-containing protein [Fibromonadaceae bacterium]|jgi:DNA-binding LytR/AlgR family response regulator|nr:LytTR family DNA-binding domain-containing protein [Fibromonadaceae bacterium]
MNILICDDIKEEADRLAALLAKSGFETQVTVFTGPWQAFNHIRSGAGVDTCFLDIMMPAMNGIKLAEKLRENNFANEIIFLTVSNDFASQSYQVKAFDYMLKPPTMDKVKSVVGALKKARENADRGKLVLKIQRITKPIPFYDISHVEVIDHTVYVKQVNKTIIEAYTAFGKISEQLLLDRRFIKCHRSFIVNMDEIMTIANKEIIMKNGTKVPVSRGHSHLVKDEMMRWMFK